jgi:SAM-dependent methyltransferase
MLASELFNAAGQSAPFGHFVCGVHIVKAKTDPQWIALGEQDPYYAVLSHEVFRTGNMDAERLGAFLATGEAHVAQLESTLARLQGPDFSFPDRVLDFGCGVGRLVIPFARRATHVCGIDVSPGMLAEAGRNCKTACLDNVTLCGLDELQANKPVLFDLIHSYIVFQHIPVEDGLRILDRLMDLLAPAGWLAVHFTFHREAPLWKRAVNAIRRRILPIHWVGNLAQGRPWNEPLIQMNHYDPGELLRRIQTHIGASAAYCEFTRHGEHIGMIIHARARLPATGSAA